MNRNNYEFSRPPETAPLPEEFPPPAAEFTPPPEEFSSSGLQEPTGEKGRKRRRLRKLLPWLAAAAVILLLGRHSGPVPEGEIAPLVIPSQVIQPLPQESTPAPEPTPEATPEPTPEPTPEQEPGCHILFFSFSHAHYTRLLFDRPEAFREVSIEIWEPQLDIQVASFSLSPEEIAAGQVDLPMISTGDVYEEHWEEYNALDTWPATLELRATLRYETAVGEVTETRTLTAGHELGWGVSYWPEDYAESDWVYPGCFVFSTYESDVPVRLVVNDPDKVKPQVLSVTLSIDGRELPAEDFQYKLLDEEVSFRHADGTETPGVLFYAFLIIQKPDWAPDSGTVHMVVTQYLESCDELWTSEGDMRYSPDGTVYD